MKQIWILLVLSILILGLHACSKSSQGHDDDTTDTADSSPSTTDSTLPADTNTDMGSDSGTSGASDSDVDSDTNVDSDTAGKSDSDTVSDSYSDSAPDSDDDTDSELGTDADSDSGGDADTAEYADTDSSAQPMVFECPNGASLGCDGADIWCFVNGVARDFIDSCEEGRLCEKVTDDSVQCRCKKNNIQKCDNNDIWNFDSCGNRGTRAEDCVEGENCVTFSDSSTECSSCGQYWGGPDCDVCGGQGEDNCQCPLGDYFPIPGTNVCWTLSTKCSVNICEAGSQFLTWEEANLSCPKGFRLPTPDEIADYLFDNAASTFDGNKYDIGSCDFFNCAQVNTYDSGLIWTAKLCENGIDHLLFRVSFGDLSCRGDERHSSANCIKK